MSTVLRLGLNRCIWHTQCSGRRVGIRMSARTGLNRGSVARRPLSTVARANKSDGEEERQARERALILSWLDVKDDTGFRGHFVSGEKAHDLDALVQNFTAPALARALRDREKLLATCARLIQSEQNYDEVKNLLAPFAELGRSDELDAGARSDPLRMPPGGIFHSSVLKRLRTRLNRMPREITKRAMHRASVILPLCQVDDEPSVLFTQRSHTLRRHKGEVCFPGGLVDSEDQTIVDAGLRELEEETGITSNKVQVLGVLRCDWSEVAAITGIAVTPVVGYIGKLEDVQLVLNSGEVHNCFTVPIYQLLNKDNWVFRELASPVFLPPGDDGSRKIWGLTGYILHRFMKLLPSVVFETDHAVSRSISFQEYFDENKPIYD